MDRKFVPVKEYFLEIDSSSVILNTTGTDDHIPEVKCRIRVIKERVKGTGCTLPFQKMLPAIIIEIIYHAVF